MVYFGKYGITGNTGIIGNIHYCSNYDCNGKVFVAIKNHWKRATKTTAEKKNLKIITCSYCDKPAVSLDHCYPYLQESTVCEDHFKSDVFNLLSGSVYNRDNNVLYVYV